MSAAQLISQRVRARTRPVPIAWDDALTCQPSELLTRLQKVRARSTATSSGSFVAAAPHNESGSSKHQRHDSADKGDLAKDELQWQDDQLTWTRGSILMRTFSFAAPVLQAFWTLFHVSSPDTIQLAPGKVRANQHPHPPARALCVFFEQAIHIHFPGLGEQVDMDLPFRFAKAFPAPVGFLVQRQIESEDVRIAAHLKRPAAPSSTQSGTGYPFPDISNSSLSSYSVSHLLDDTDQSSKSQLYEDSSRLLPTVFYLSRCYDDLVPVDRFPQLSFAPSPAKEPKPMTHGPGSPFGEMDETITFVSTEDDERFPQFVVTTSRKNSAIRVYSFAARSSAFEATATLLSTPRIHSTLSNATAGGRSDGAEGMHALAPQHHDDIQRPSTNGSRGLTDTLAATTSSTALGRGFPSNVRRSSRLEMARRSSGLTSANMGRDPNGRSRRINAMHTGAVDRRAAGRKDDQASQGRDRTLGSISHTADGLRLQSQAYQHDAMMEELGASGTSIHITANATSAARLRRNSQAAARTPYAGPRTSNRPASSAIKSRPSMSLSRLETSMDMGRLTSAITGNIADPIRADAMDAESGLAEDDDVDLARIADMDSFARSFACVCLLDEIKIPAVATSLDAAAVQVSSARFERDDPDAAYLFLSVPFTKQTFCRRLGYQCLGIADRSRNLPFCRMPSKTLASATMPYCSAVPVRSLVSNSTEVVTISPSGGIQLHFNPPSSVSRPLDISSSGPLKQAMRVLAGSPTHSEALSQHPSRSLRLVSTGSMQRVDVDVDIDFRPRCPTTTRLLRTLNQVLPSKLSAKIKTRWIQQRFLFGDERPRRYGRAAVDEDWSAFLRALASPPRHSADSGTHGHSDTELCSRAHQLFGDDPLLSNLVPLAPTLHATMDGETSKTENTLERTEAESILLALYLFAEETHLDTSHPAAEVGKIADLATAFASDCRASAWTEAFRCRFPSYQELGSRELVIEIESLNDAGRMINAPPIDLYRVLLGMGSGIADQIFSCQSWIKFGSGSAAFSVQHVAAAFPLLDAVLRTFTVFRQAHPGRQHLSTAVVESMISHGLDLERLRKLPFGVALPLYEAIRCCQIDPRSGRSADFYRIVQRAELVLNTSTQRASLPSTSARQIPKQLIRTLPEDAPLDAICAQLFSRDFRLRDVVAMLRTDAVNSVYVAEGENQTEAAITEQHNAAVAAIGERTKALPAGRAMLFMSSRPFSSTHKWRISPICLAVKVRPRGTTIGPDTRAESAGLDWPEFHNGVASVLELDLTANVNVDSKWIFAHLGEQVNARHAGFLFGLGLMKQLPTLTPVHVFRYLKMRNNLLTTGFLLGMAVSTVGTADPTARHLIGMQLTAFLPPGSAPLNLSTITQAAGLLAMGLVFLGSNHRWTAKRMLEQIGATESPIPDVQSQHREAYSVSAALALGLVYLGKGRCDGMKSLPDKRIVARLVHLVKGSGDTLDATSLADNSRPCDTSKEEPEMNLTSAPAALAFGLIYMRSGCQTIANIMAPPQAPRELDLLRPDVLLVHTLARSLILWESIEPTKKWLASVLPDWMQKRIDSGKTLSEVAQLAQINMQAGAYFAIGLKYAGSMNQKARDCLWEQLEKLDRQVKVQTASFFSKIRKAAAQSALDQVKISLAMVLAGSGDVDLLRHLRRAHGDVDGETCYGSHMATHMALGLLFLGGGRFTLGASDVAIAALLISFLPPFPRWSGDNRAHLQAFRHLWYLAIEPRLLVATDVDTDELVSLPVRVVDGSGASTKHRAFTPLLLSNQRLSGPIESVSSRYWPASIDSRTAAEQNTTLASSAASIARATNPSTSQILFVKRKTAHLDYLVDPHGSRSLSSRALETAPMDASADVTELVGTGASELREAMRGFTAAGKHRELVRSLGNLSESSTADKTDIMAPWMRTMVMDCLAMDKMYILPTYASILQLEQGIVQGSRAWLKHHRDLCFADDFYQQHYERLFPGHMRDSSKQWRLIQPDLLERLRRQAQRQGQALYENDFWMRETIFCYLTGLQDTISDKALDYLEAADFWSALIAGEVPSATEVRSLVDEIDQWISWSIDDDTQEDEVKARISMITDTAFGGARRPPWTSYILDHIVEGLIERNVSRG
ncbi:related to negative regulator of mitosis [Melanopsichium pennsylvanicum]|uniref:Related to negative regulator of mitosis n=2 Tax=Melanopsichium pennsylvanicum TaxID=63383 RepID=A0AAJ4XGX4_9BASI|nr:related to negative regulator of mitosis [Melanopsichium pennsylvanicum 4]SNX82102.1 related to negative regulator of mitosis [Melanopsichium pennsylvanicum]